MSQILTWFLLDEKFILEIEETDLIELIERVQKIFEYSITEKGLKVILDLGKNFHAPQTPLQ